MYETNFALHWFAIQADNASCLLTIPKPYTHPSMSRIRNIVERRGVPQPHTHLARANFSMRARAWFQGAACAPIRFCLSHFSVSFTQVSQHALRKHSQEASRHKLVPAHATQNNFLCPALRCSPCTCQEKRLAVQLIPLRCTIAKWLR